MELSYAQNLEDYHLWLAFAGQTIGRYVDVGAGHPRPDVELPGRDIRIAPR